MITLYVLCWQYRALYSLKLRQKHEHKTKHIFNILSRLKKFEIIQSAKSVSFYLHSYETQIRLYFKSVRALRIVYNMLIVIL